MSEDQENIPLTTMPRPASPTKPAVAASGGRGGIPVPTARPLGAAKTLATNKRPSPSSAVAPPLKRITRSSTGSAGGSGPASQSLPAAQNANGMSTRTTAPRKAALPSRTGAPRAPMSTTSAKAAPKPITKAVTARRAPGTNAAAAAAKPAPRNAAGVGRPTRPLPSRKTETPQEPVVDRMTSMENMIALMLEETAKISATQKTQEEQNAQARALEAQQLEARRSLSASSEELREMREAHLREVDDLERQILRKEREKSNIEDELKEVSVKLSEERETSRSLRQELSEQGTKHIDISARLTAAETRNEALKAEVDRATIAVSAMKAELATKQEQVAKEIADAEQRVKDAKDECAGQIASIEAELRNAETIRRKLHNMVQELKGNIRVFARVRPPLAHELNNPEGLATITYGDERVAAETGQSHLTVVSKSESAMGKEREQVNLFTFDKVFQPKHGQQDVFEEISMLAQSVLDGYNVCIFAYGQTGSGKSWTMEGGDTPDTQGMIPRAIDMIFAVSSQLRDRGWIYEMDGTFLEVYNDVINDLLGTSQFDSKKHEIKIDKDNRMTVTDIVSLPLSHPRQVAVLLERARSRRAVAATLMNERSSRSHSVFSLKVKGINAETGESSEGILNLVDLAGSERLASSGAGENKERLKETININKSLSALADVIGALGSGQQGGHVPYRNSTLTRLLQTSLSGSSKTLMLCNLSPLAAHLGETVCTLRFATKVNSTPAGTARRSMGKT